MKSLLILFCCVFGSTTGQRISFSDLNGIANKYDTGLNRVTRDVTNWRDSCRLPSMPGVSVYKIDQSICENSCNRIGGELISTNETVRLQCALGYGPANSNTQNDVKYICNNGAWYESEPECIKLCPPLKKEKVNVECVFNGESVSCDNYMKPGTTARFHCKEFYRASYDPTSFSDSTRCLLGGRWSDSLPTCSLVCGRVFGVTGASSNKHPWHVAVYISSSNRFEYICGGSLISENFVLSAAHCVVDPESQAKFKEEDIKVAVGKAKSDYYIQEPYQVNSDVINIMIPDNYVGDGARYAEDIALLHTAVNFKFNQFVLPVCIDQYLRMVKFPNNLKGTIFGWGLKEKNVLSKELQEVQLPTMPIARCRQLFNYFQQYLADDKYCVIHQNGSGTQKGDSGGGMTFEARRQHYIYGIVSTKPTDTNQFSVFTNVSSHLNWIYSSMRNSSPNTISRRCGIINTKAKFGGKLVEYPWYVSLLSRNKRIVNDTSDSKTGFCSGTLIHEYFVLTAARCVIDIVKFDRSRYDIRTAYPEEDIAVLPGAYVHNSVDHVHNVTKIIIPEAYMGRLDRFAPFPYDIALLQVGKPFKFNDFVLPACLDRSSSSFLVQPDDSGTYEGWRRKGSYDLVPVSVSVPDSYLCEKKYENYTIDADKFCVRYKNGLPPPDMLLGGNGLTVLYKGRHYLRGIYCLQLGDNHMLPLFTNLSVYHDWIFREIENRPLLS